MNQSAEKVVTLGDYGRLVRRRWKYLATIVPAFLLAAIFYAYLVQPIYRSSGTLMLEPSALPANLVPSLVGRVANADLEASQQIELLRRRVMTPDALQGIARRTDPYPGEAGLDLAAKAARIARDTSIEPVDPVTSQPKEFSTAFAIHYDNPDPRIAKAVAEQLLELFVTYNRRMRAERAGEAYRFLREQAAQLETSMTDMEQRLAAFKARYGDALPESQNRNLLGMDRAQRDLDMVQRDILSAQERENLLAVQLEALSPSLAVAVGDWRTELSKLRGELAAAEQKYTADHPDVRRLRRAVAEMAAQGGSTDARSARVPDNPEYLRVRSQLDSVRRERDSLQARAQRIRGEYAAFQRNVTTAPTVEREYVRLVREYENAHKRYVDVQDKIKGASLSRELETEARGERFTLIREASSPGAPYSPNRVGILLLGLLLGMALAVITALMADASDPAVRGTEDLRARFDAPPLGAIPPIANAADRQRRKRAIGTAALAYLGAAAAAVAVIMAA
ncbi:MAG: GumC family protein [Pseudomonadota bacterium]